MVTQLVSGGPGVEPRAVSETCFSGTVPDYLRVQNGLPTLIRWASAGAPAQCATAFFSKSTIRKPWLIESLTLPRPSMWSSEQSAEGCGPGRRRGSPRTSQLGGGVGAQSRDWNPSLSALSTTCVTGGSVQGHF